MIERKNSMSNNLYNYFDKYRTEEAIKQNHQEIEHAINTVAPCKHDEKIQRIWEILLE